MRNECVPIKIQSKVESEIEKMAIKLRVELFGLYYKSHWYLPTLKVKCYVYVKFDETTTISTYEWGNL